MSQLARARTGLPGWLPAAVLLVALLWLLRDTAAAMVSIWWRSETYTHAFLVPPISLWLAWRRRGELAGVELRARPWMLVPIAAICLLWLAAELAAVAAASQFALVSLVVLLVPTMFGWQATRVMLFPLGFLYFSVPVGEFLVPTLIDHTADFTVAALRASGIPVYREGTDFVIPSGSWSVVEACSGVRYLIASLMVGTLYANLNYRSLSRRLMFVAVAIVVPIIANWLRAYMIVMIGHLSGNTLAVGVDHLIYGWVFFGVVIGLMFLIGSRWADAPDLPAATGARADGGAAQAVPGPRAWALGLAVVAMVAAAQLWIARLEHDPAAQRAPTLVLPADLGGSWAPDAAVDLQWRPGFVNPSATVAQGYRQGERTAWLWIGYYRGQGPERKLVSSMNLLASEDGPKWTQSAAGKMQLPRIGLEVMTGELREVRALIGATPQRLRVWQLYWIDGHLTGSEIEVKLRQAWARLRGRGDDGAVLLLATPAGDTADATLQAFAAASLEPLTGWLDKQRAGR